MNLQVFADFKVIDESKDWLVVHKPAPLIVHPANRQLEPTLLGGIQKLLAYECANGNQPAIVNRLDRETSGLVLVAKHKQAARELGLLFERREVEKEYVAIVHGWPEADSWVADAPIRRAGEVEASPIWVRQIVHPEGKACRTSFEVLKRWGRDNRAFSLVRCIPETGRMHQIRVHFAHGKHPIVGDKIYSGDGSEYLAWMENGWSEQLQERLLISRHALHACRLSLWWDGVRHDWESPLPSDLEKFLETGKWASNPDIVIWNRNL